VIEYITADVLVDVAIERRRQKELIVAGKIPFGCEHPATDNGYKLAVLTEEVGEVARAIIEDESAVNLREELIQVAAVAVAWAEALTP
jgi:NTP pyrophosphatase (non-canonical NTP hydrolase)